MNRRGRRGDEPESLGEPRVEDENSILDAQRALNADQTGSDSDQTGSTADQQNANHDQAASDRDQAAADLDHAAHPDLSAAEELAYEAARDERAAETIGRQGTRRRREAAAHDRDVAAADRDRVAEARDSAGRNRDARATDLAHRATVPDSSLAKELEEIGARAAIDRARAATDRARAAKDRADAARERERLEAELASAHLDDLTGAYRREMGQMTLSHEIDRARRSDGRFVLAFVDVDRLKEVNDRDGHAAGDRVLQTVVTAIRSRLRSFDPIFRYGGDEFVCGLIGTDLAEAGRRFESIGIAIEADARVGISVGLAELIPGDTVDQLTERADAAMREVKEKHHGG